MISDPETLDPALQVRTVDTHTAGEPTRILQAGTDIPTLSGESVRAKRDVFANEYDHLRELLMQEPRGHDNMFGAVVVEPTVSAADLGVFFMDGDGYLDMCGHGTLGVVTAMIELGKLESSTIVQVETPAGVVTTHPDCTGGRVDQVTLENVESFVYDRTTVPVSFLEAPLAVTVVYAGNFIGLVDSEQLNVPLDTARIDAWVDRGLEIRSAVNEALDIVHPFSGDPAEVSITEFYETTPTSDRSFVIFGDGQVDRSPCGTGTCAKMALLHDAGELAVGDSYPHESPIGTQFEGRIVDTYTRDGTTVTVPTVTGSAYITGMHTFVRTENDQLTGFRIGGDTPTEKDPTLVRDSHE